MASFGSKEMKDNNLGDIKLKTMTKLITMFMLLTLTISAAGLDSKPAPEVNDSSKLNLQAEFSLFYEFYKNKDYLSAYNHGWNVINTDPSAFMRFKPFRKMEDVLWFMHDSVATFSDEEKQIIADTTLYLYDKALEYNEEKAAYFLSKKAYVLETWINADPEVVIEAYRTALASDNGISSGYKDRLGLILSKNSSEDNDYKMQALELYSALSEAEPDNALWIQRIEALAEDPNELVEITGKAWRLDPENPEKAWKYASMALRNQDYSTALEPLKFLIEKSPEVINYHKQIARAYEKLDETDAAIQSYKTLIELEPDNRDNFFNLAIIYQKLGQLSVARSYLQKASKVSPDWDYPIFIEAQLYEAAARNCGFEYEDKLVYLLAVQTYQRVVSMGGQYASAAKERINALANSIPQKEDYFFRKVAPGTVIKIEGKCYDWINKSVVIPD